MPGDASPNPTYDVLAIAAHPDDVEVSLGGTIALLTARGRRVLLVDLTDGEPTRHAARGVRRQEAARAAAILGADRIVLGFQDRLLEDTIAARVAVAQLIRRHRPRIVFSTLGSGVHPDHQAATDIVVNGVFYARLTKWDEVPGGEALAGSEPHEIDRLFYGRCRMEEAWERFDFAVDVSAVYDRKLEAIRAYQSVFSGARAGRPEGFRAEDRHVGSLLGVEYGEPLKARAPLLVEDPTVFLRAPFG
jgi:N-acetylglucosamine malate deacetylase 1